MTKVVEQASHRIGGHALCAPGQPFVLPYSTGRNRADAPLSFPKTDKISVTPRLGAWRLRTVDCLGGGKPRPARGISMKAPCTLQRMGNSRWSVHHSSSALGTVTVSASS